MMHIIYLILKSYSIFSFTSLSLGIFAKYMLVKMQKKAGHSAMSGFYLDYLINDIVLVRDHCRIMFRPNYATCNNKVFNRLT